MNKSPWSAYGRMGEVPKRQPPRATPDPTFGALRNVDRGREQLDKCMQSALRDYFEITSGYKRMIAAALEPAPEPESIEERLKRLAREHQLRNRDRRLPGR